MHHLIEESFWKLLETLSTHEALLVVQFSIAVDDLLSRTEATPAPLTGGTGQGIGNAASTRSMKIHVGVYCIYP